ncbi:hemerythrin-like protein [Gracilaria domingensis]|nr:hemerythrin-like protein [Gracilaria domingensis]
MSGRWSEGYSFIPFDPKELDRKFIKKAVNSEGVMVEKEITNSWEGLLAYFQAPNIRFKIRHPLFLAIRFSNVLVILRDSLRFPQESEEALRSFICSCGFPLNCKRDPAVKIGHGEFLPPWLIAPYESCQGPALGFVPDDSLLPQRYSPTFDVASLGQLYSKLYAIEFASSLEEKSNGNTHSSIMTKKPKTKMEPVESDTVLGYHPCGTPIYAPESGRVRSTVSHAGESSSSSRGPSQQMRTSFESYFISLHGELRMLLQKVVELVSQCVTDPLKADKETLRKAYEDFTEALSVHAYVEEQVMFKKLSDRVPRVTESYSVDHWLEKGKMDEIANIMRDMDPQKIADLFLKISELAAVHKVHMDKEEFHLLPYFLDHFSDEEIIDLIRQSQETFHQYFANSRKGGDRRISLMNPRHKRAIQRAMEAAGIDFQPDENTVDPPEQINDRCFNENSDEVLALIDEMYR